MGYPRVPDLQMPEDPAALGYLAGIVDGEGCITIRRAFNKDTSRSTSHSVVVTVATCDPRMAEWLATIVGGGTVHVDKSRRPGWKPRITWTLTGRNVAAFLAPIRPYLVLKGEQADVALALRRLSQGRWQGRRLAAGVVEEREALKQQIHVLNKRGVA